MINNKQIRDLLKEYWNLNIEFKTPDGYFSNIKLNTEVAKDVDKISVAKISQAIHDDLIPVGSINEDSALLLLSDSGKFYMITDNDVYKIRDNFFDTLKAIIFQDDVTRFHFNKV
jgi:ATP-dependent exoDNAse (exonuclease V) alpha subunit